MTVHGNKIPFPPPVDGAAGAMKLVLYSLVGQEVGVPVNEEQEAGYRSVCFDASRLPSGVYTYRIVAGTFTDAKKMMLIK